MTIEEADQLVAKHPECEPWISQLVGTIKELWGKGRELRKARQNLKMSGHRYAEGALRSLEIFARVSMQLGLGGAEQNSLAIKVASVIHDMRKRKDLAPNILDRAFSTALAEMNAEIERQRTGELCA
jgi:hypothetical protein